MSILFPLLWITDSLFCLFFYKGINGLLIKRIFIYKDINPCHIYITKNAKQIINNKKNLSLKIIKSWKISPRAAMRVPFLFIFHRETPKTHISPIVLNYRIREWEAVEWSQRCFINVLNSMTKTKTNRTAKHVWCYCKDNVHWVDSDVWQSKYSKC